MDGMALTDPCPLGIGMRTATLFSTHGQSVTVWTSRGSTPPHAQTSSSHQFQLRHRRAVACTRRARYRPCGRLFLHTAARQRLYSKV